MPSGDQGWRARIRVLGGVVRVGPFPLERGLNSGPLGDLGRGSRDLVELRDLLVVHVEFVPRLPRPRPGAPPLERGVPAVGQHSVEQRLGEAGVLLARGALPVPAREGILQLVIRVPQHLQPFQIPHAPEELGVAIPQLENLVHERVQPVQMLERVFRVKARNSQGGISRRAAGRLTLERQRAEVVGQVADHVLVLVQAPAVPPPRLRIGQPEIGQPRVRRWRGQLALLRFPPRTRPRLRSLFAVTAPTRLLAQFLVLGHLAVLVSTTCMMDDSD